MSPEMGTKVWSLGRFLNEPIYKPKPLLDPWLREGDQWMVYAEAGLGKTFFSLNVAYAVAAGGEYLGWKAPSAQSVLYVDGEMETWEMQDRLAGINAAGKRDGKGDLKQAGRKFTGWCATYQDQGKMFPDFSLEKGLEVLLEKSRHKSLVVIDNLTTTMRTGDDNTALWWQPMSEALVELKKQRTAVLLVHHTNKSGDQRGTSAKDVTLNGKIALVHPPDHNPADGAAFVLRWPKHRGLTGPDVAEINAKLTEDDVGIPAWDYTRLDASKHLELMRLAKSGEYSTQREITEAMGVTSPSYVTKLKQEAIGLGLFTADEFKRWLRTARDLQEMEMMGSKPDF